MGSGGVNGRFKVNKKKRVSSHHGLLFGHVQRAITAMQLIYDCETTTNETREKASLLEGQLVVLQNLLKTRRK